MTIKHLKDVRAWLEVKEQERGRTIPLHFIEDNAATDWILEEANK